MAPWTALFPPGKGGGEGVAHGRKGKGVLIRSLTAGHGMPLAHRTTPANGDERAPVLPLLDAVKVRTGNRGAHGNVSRSSQRIKGMMPKRCGSNSGGEGSGHSSQSEAGRPRKTVVGRSKKGSHGAKRSGRLPGSRRNIAA